MGNSRRIHRFLSGGILIVIFATSAGVCFGTESHAARIVPLKPGTELLVGDRSLPDPLRPYEFEEKPDLAKRATIKETAGCKTLQSWEPTIVSRAHWQTVGQLFASEFAQTGVLAVLSATNCLKIGIPARIVQLDPASGVTTLMGWFLPTGIVGHRPEYSGQEKLLLISAGLGLTTAPIAFVSGRVISTIRPLEIGDYAPRMNGARFIDRDQMESAIKDGAQIIDVRKKKEFDFARVKGSIHVPYTAGPRMRVLDEYSNYAKAGDAFDIRRISPDREKPVILIGEGPHSDGLFRAGVVLQAEGWKKVFLFFEGFNYFGGNAFGPPIETIFYASVNESAQLLALRADRAMGVKLIDVRSPREFTEGSIPGSISVPYLERDDLRLRRQGLNGEMLIAYGDTWALPASLTKTTPIVIIGESIEDWRAYKAGLVARAMGYTAVYRFNPGVFGWRLSGLYNSRFPIAVAGKSGVK